MLKTSWSIIILFLSLQSISFEAYSQSFDEDSLQFFDDAINFKQVLTQVGIPQSSKIPNVLTIGSGRGMEIMALTSYLRLQNLTSIDPIRPDADLKISAKVRFIYDTYPKEHFTQKFDLIIMRHPIDEGKDEAPYSSMLTKAIEQLQDKGVLIITHYTPIEDLYTLQAMYTALLARSDKDSWSIHRQENKSQTYETISGDAYGRDYYITTLTRAPLQEGTLNVNQLEESIQDKFSRFPNLTIPICISYFK